MGLDSSILQEGPFQRCLEFMYTGSVELSESDDESLEQISAAAHLFQLPELALMCANAKKEEDFLNPSIGTWLNDRNSSTCKKLFFNQPLLSDIRLKVEGRVIHAHKVVLSSRSEVFAAMLKNGFIESETSEVSGK